jgi:HK97 family phage major capsid protein
MTDETLLTDTPAIPAPEIGTPDAAPYLADDTPGRIGDAVKSLGNGMIGGYLAYFRKPGDSADLQNEYFTKATDFCLDRYPIVGQAFVLYQHGQDGTLRKSNLGDFIKARVDDVGLWAEAQLAMADEYATAIERLIATGKFYWSSGSVPQLTQVENGEIKRWPVVEGSITYSPAQPLTTRIYPIKALTADAPSFRELVRVEEARDTEDAPAAGEPPAAKTQPDGAPATAHPTTKESEMDLMQIVMQLAAEWNVELSAEQLAAAVEKLSTSHSADVEAVTAPEATLEDEGVMKSLRTIAQAFAKHVNGLSAQSAERAAATIKNIATAITPAPAGQNRVSNGSVKASGAAAIPQPTGYGAPAYIEDYSLKSRWSNISPRAASMALQLGQQMFDKERPGQRFLPGGVETGLEVVKRIIANGAVEMAGKSTHHGASFEDRAAKVNLSPSEQHFMKSVAAGKADELGYSSQANYGADWVWTFWQQQIMEQARRENVVMSNLPVVDMPADVHEIPVSWTDPTIYYAAESTELADLNSSTSNVTMSKVGTNKLQLNAKKFGVRVGWSSELDEDSIINYANVAQEQATRAIQNGLDYVILNGDTTNSSSNINDDVGSIATGTSFLALDGLRHLALVTTTANVVNGGGGAITYKHLTDLRSKLPREASSDQGQIMYFANPELLASLLQIPEFLTMDKLGPNATAVTGQFASVGQIPFLFSSQLYKAQATGFVSLTADNNDFGQVVCVYLPYQRVGLRRRITPYLSRSDDGESWTLTITARIDYKTRPSNDSVAVLKNVLS